MELSPRPIEHSMTQHERALPDVPFTGGARETVIPPPIPYSALDAVPEFIPPFQAAEVSGEVAVGQVVEAEPSSEQQSPPVPKLVFLPPSDAFERPAADETVEADDGSQQAAEATDMPPTAEDDAMPDCQPTMRWRPGQASNAIRAAIKAGVDVDALLPQMPHAPVVRGIVDNIVNGKTVSEAAAAAYCSDATVIRTTQRVASAIKAGLDTQGYPEGLAPEMFVPHKETPPPKEKPTDYAMEPVAELLADRGITQEDLCVKLCIAPVTLQRVLQGTSHGSNTLVQVILHEALPDDPERAQAIYEKFKEERAAIYGKSKGRPRI